MIEARIRSFYEAIDAQRWDEQAAMASSGFVARLGSLPPMSFDGWQGRLREFYTGFPDGHHELEFHEVAGDRILTMGRFVGTHRGVFMGSAPTGRAVSMAVMHVDRVVDGMVVEHVAQADLMGLSRQIGQG